MSDQLSDTDIPFLQAPDDAVETLHSIEGWPSVLSPSPANSDPSDPKELQTFRALPRSVQEEFMHYPGIVQQAFIKFAESGNPRSTVEWIVNQVPGMLLRTDHTGYIPIEAALESGKGDAAKVMLNVAQVAGSLDKLLNFRNPRYGHNLIMLAVHLNDEKWIDIFRKLVASNPAGLHQFYDNEGRNVLHRCTQFGLVKSFRIILHLLRRFPSVHREQVSSEVKKALEMTDRQKNTPIHYIAYSGRTEMFKVLKNFLNEMSISVDFDVVFKGSSSSLTPLMVGVQRGYFEVCKWLLENGSVDVHFKQHSTCLTALHFAVRAGNVELIELLMKHGASPVLSDKDCDFKGYKTPLELAQSEKIPNKQACLLELKRTK